MRQAVPAASWLGHSPDTARYIFDMLAFALLFALGGLSLIISGMARGELADHRPSSPAPRWRLVIGAMAFAGGTLITVATIAVPRLAPPPETANVDQPFASFGSIERASTASGTLRN